MTITERKGSFSSPGRVTREDWRTGVIERRASPREPMCCGALLEMRGRALAVNVLDLSEGGAAVEAPSDLGVPGDEGRLVFGVAVVPVRVVTIEEGRFGLAFTAVSQVAAETIADILAAGGPDPDA